MTAKEQALRDIHECLKEEGKCFLHFIKELDPVMDEIVEIYSQEQQKMGDRV